MLSVNYFIYNSRNFFVVALFHAYIFHVQKSFEDHADFFLIFGDDLQGMPDWQKIIEELPPMDALLSKLER